MIRLITKRFQSISQELHYLTNIRLLGVLVVSLLLSACNDETIYSKLSEQEANEMVSLLVSSGIAAKKVALRGDIFKVTTASKHFSPAVQILRSSGFPKEKYTGVGDVFSNDSLVSSREAERARLNFALSQEIADTLSNVDGVLIARVHLAVPPRDDFTNELPAASASVFIKHRSDIDLSASTSSIKNIVVNGIENLPYDNVTVAFFKATNTSAVSLDASTAIAVSSADKNLLENPLQQMRLSSMPSVSPMILVYAGMAFGLLLVLGSFWRRKPQRVLIRSGQLQAEKEPRSDKTGSS